MRRTKNPVVSDADGTWRKVRTTALALGSFLVVAVVLAPEARAATPCCSVISIDASRGLVTAKETATGRTFQFKLSNASPQALKNLKVGQKVDADFRTGNVTVPMAGTEALTGKIHGAEPCCPITAIDASRGVVTAKEAASGGTFRFEIRDSKLLGSLKVGQKIWADFGTKKVSIHYGEPCCFIL